MEKTVTVLQNIFGGKFFPFFVWNRWAGHDTLNIPAHAKRRVPLQTSLFSNFFFVPFGIRALGASWETREENTKIGRRKKATEKSSFALRKQKQKRKQKVPLTSKRHEWNEEFAQPHELPWWAYSLYTMLLILFLLSIRTPLGWRLQKRAKNSLLTASRRPYLYYY